MEQPILPFTNQYKKYSQSVMPFIENQKTKSYSTVIFFFLVLSMFSWYAIRPTVQTILYLQREIKDKTEVNKKMDEKIAALIEANSAYENAQTLLPALSETIPSTPEALDLVSQMQRLGGEKNVTISSLQMNNVPLTTASVSGVSKTNQSQTELPILFTIEGLYPSTVEFLKELITMRRLVTIQSIILSPARQITSSSPDPAKSSMIKVLVNLLGYYETK